MAIETLALALMCGVFLYTYLKEQDVLYKLTWLTVAMLCAISAFALGTVTVSTTQTGSATSCGPVCTAVNYVTTYSYAIPSSDIPMIVGFGFLLVWVWLVFIYRLFKAGVAAWHM
jgi:hypothetical protein